MNYGPGWHALSYDEYRVLLDMATHIHSGIDLNDVGALTLALMSAGYRARDIAPRLDPLIELVNTRRRAA